MYTRQTKPLAGFILLGNDHFCQENWFFVADAFKGFVGF